MTTCNCKSTGHDSGCVFSYRNKGGINSPPIKPRPDKKPVSYKPYLYIDASECIRKLKQVIKRLGAIERQQKLKKKQNKKLEQLEKWVEEYDLNDIDCVEIFRRMVLDSIDHLKEEDL
ncbi:MAG: hypothetical protein ACFFDH_00275 [Promethearchaeota archaeon]